MHFQIKMPENGRRNKFRDKETTEQVLLMFLVFKMLTER